MAHVTSNECLRDAHIVGSMLPGLVAVGLAALVELRFQGHAQPRIIKRAAPSAAAGAPLGG